MKMYRKPCQKTWRWGGMVVNAELIFLFHKTYQLQIKKTEENTFKHEYKHYTGF
jgi:hypothetical protein